MLNDFQKLIVKLVGISSSKNGKGALLMAGGLIMMFIMVWREAYSTLSIPFVITILGLNTLPK